MKNPISIILNVESLNTFPLKSGIRQRNLLSPLQFNIVLKVLELGKKKKRKPKRKKKIKRNKKHTDWKGKVKLSLFAGNIILQKKILRNSHQNNYQI